jgi:hypothetical protein
LKSVPRVEKGIGKGLKKVEDAMGSVVSRAEVGKTFYDSKSHILWSQIEMDIAGVGTVRGLLALILTERGAIQVVGYAPATEFDRYGPLFERIARNVSIPEEIRYRPRITDSIPIVSRIDWYKVLVQGILGAVIGGVVGLIAWMRRKQVARKSQQKGDR